MVYISLNVNFRHSFSTLGLHPFTGTRCADTGVLALVIGEFHTCGALQHVLTLVQTAVPNATDGTTTCLAWYLDALPFVISARIGTCSTRLVRSRIEDPL
jgi:hypothetical protein